MTNFRSVVGDATLSRLRLAVLDRRPDDQYIAAFPRSGSTWLRTMITNVLVPGANSNPKVFNAQIPGITFRKMRHVRSQPSPRLLMTHSPWLSAFPRVVYLVRDGRDAVVSYYHYVVTRAGGTQTFDAFLDDYYRGVHGTPWHRHVEGWLDRGPQRLGDNLQIVTFEHLKADTPGELGRVLAFLRIPASADQVKEAIGLASLDNAKRLEAQRRGPLASPDASFYRGGSTGTRDPLLGGDRLARFEAASARALVMAGYPVSRTS